MKKIYIYISIINLFFVIIPFILVSFDYTSSNFTFKYYKIVFFYFIIIDFFLFLKLIKKELNFFLFAFNILIQTIPVVVFIYMIFNLH